MADNWDMSSEAIPAVGRLRWLPRGMRLVALEAALGGVEGRLVLDLEEQRPLLAALARDAVGRRGNGALRLLCLTLGRNAEARLGGAGGNGLLDAIDGSRVEAAVDSLLASDRGDERAAGAALIGAAPIPAMVDRLAALLADAEIGAAAERSLATLVERAALARVEGRGLALGAAGRALEGALEQFGAHRRAGVLDLALTLVHRGVRLSDYRGRGTGEATNPAWLTGTEEAAGMAMRRLLRRDDREAVASAAWLWLAVPGMASAALQRLARTAPGLEAVLARVHLVSNPARAVALRRLVESDGSVPAAVLPSAQAVSAMRPAARRGYARWVMALGAPSRLSDAALGGLLADSDATVRHAAARAASTPARGATPACLVDLAFDADPRVARTATLGLMARPDRALVRDPLRERALAALVRSPHPGVAWLARSARVGDAFDSPESPAARLLLRRELAIAPARVLGRLAGALADPDARRVASAAALVRAMALGPRLETALVDAARARWLSAASSDGAADARALARVLTALADVPGEAATRMLTEAAGHTDARVRANAIDALARRARVAVLIPTGVSAAVHDVLRERIDDEAHRPRASAARALLLTGAPSFPRAASARDAGERALLSMLEDARPMHRVAGLWLAERAASRVAPLPEIVEAVAGLARAAGGDVHGLNIRARATAQRLLAEVRLGWTLRAASVETTDETPVNAREAVA